MVILVNPIFLRNRRLRELIFDSNLRSQWNLDYHDNIAFYDEKRIVFLIVIVGSTNQKKERKKPVDEFSNTTFDSIEIGEKKKFAM
ncbi:hypothetical protein DERF_009756 [Dermatophagoides farinae]|uniref:Uncharacterized protein n=1 Tax=Dermatophagoides farinae TaxID=6954 RepID=A0A922HXK3_DERFA|nr:hypothetical protein DERF_009756 [Dermatophagoides farinae]